MLKKWFFVSFLAFSACIKGEVLVEEELKIEFEDVWWELTDIPGWTDQDGRTYCYYFDSGATVGAPSNGEILYYLEGDLLSYILSNLKELRMGMLCLSMMFF